MLILFLVSDPYELTAEEKEFSLIELNNPACFKCGSFSMMYRNQHVAKYVFTPNSIDFYDKFDKNGQTFTIRKNNLEFDISQIVFKISKNKFILISYFDFYCIYGSTSSGDLYNVKTQKAFKIFNKHRRKNYYIYYVVAENRPHLSNPFYSDCIYGRSHILPDKKDEFILPHYWINAPSTYLTSFYIRCYFLNQLEREIKNRKTERMDVNAITSLPRNFHGKYF